MDTEEKSLSSGLRGFATLVEVEEWQRGTSAGGAEARDRGRFDASPLHLGSRLDSGWRWSFVRQDLGLEGEDENDSGSPSEAGSIEQQSVDSRLGGVHGSIAVHFSLCCDATLMGSRGELEVGPRSLKGRLSDDWM